jgi:hypothetical protein
MTEVEFETARETVAIGDTLRVCYKSVYSSADTRTEMTVEVEEATAGDSEDTLTVSTGTGDRYRLVLSDSEARVLTERSSGWMRISEEGSVEVHIEAAEEPAEPEESEETTEDTEESEAAESAGESEEEPAAEFVGTKETSKGVSLLQYRTRDGMPVAIRPTGRESGVVYIGAADMTEEVGEAIARDRGITEWALGPETLADESRLPEWLTERLSGEVEEPAEPEESEETAEDTEETEADESAAEEREEDTAETEEVEETEETEEPAEPDLDQLHDTAERLSDLGLLSEGQAKVYLAREVHGMGRSEAAEALDMAPSTTDTHRQRAKPKVEDLREALDLLDGYESVANE